MAIRNNVKILTKYKTIDECIESCLDYYGEARFYSSFYRGIGGTISKSGEFNISSKTRGSGIFQFIGKIEEVDGNIYLVGDISEKAVQIKIIYISILFMILLGFFIIFVMAPLGILIGPLFMIVPWFNLLYVKRSDALYHEIVRKVS